MVIAPMDTPGVQIVLNIPVMHHLSLEGHCEIVFRDVRVPAENLVGEEGKGFALRRDSAPAACITACAPSASASSPSK